MPVTLIHAQRCWDYTSKDYTRQGEPIIFGSKDAIPDYITAGAGAPEDVGGERVPADWKRKVVVLYGPNSTGKSWTANAECKEFADGAEPFRLQTAAGGQKGRWPGGYAGERTAIIDEFGWGDFPLAQLKTLLDRAPAEVATGMGGASVLWKPELIFVCINCTPAEMKEFAKHPQWDGRIHEYRFMNKKISAPGSAPAVWLDCPDDLNPNYSDGSAYVAPSLPEVTSSRPLKRTKSAPASGASSNSGSLNVPCGVAGRGWSSKCAAVNKCICTPPLRD